MRIIKWKKIRNIFKWNKSEEIIYQKKKSAITEKIKWRKIRENFKQSSMRWFNLTQLDIKEMLTMNQILYMNKVNIFLFFKTRWNRERQWRLEWRFLIGRANILLGCWWKIPLKNFEIMNFLCKKYFYTKIKSDFLRRFRKMSLHIVLPVKTGRLIFFAQSRRRTKNSQGYTKILSSKVTNWNTRFWHLFHYFFGDLICEKHLTNM